VLDSNPTFVTEPETFGNAFNNTYRGIIDYRPNTQIVEVDAATHTVVTAAGPVRADVLNVIPNQRAGQFAFDARLVNVDGRWAGVGRSDRSLRPRPRACT